MWLCAQVAEEPEGTGDAREQKKESREYLYVKDCVVGMKTRWRKTKGPVDAFNLGHDVVKEYTSRERGWLGDNKLVELSWGKVINAIVEDIASPQMKL